MGYDKLTRAFEARFVACSRVSRPFDSLITMSMEEGETLRAYFDRYWEFYNEIGENNERVALSNFKVSLPIDFELKTSLTLRLVTDMHELMERVEEYKRLKVVGQVQIQGIYSHEKRGKNGLSSLA